MLLKYGATMNKLLTSTLENKGKEFAVHFGKKLLVKAGHSTSNLWNHLKDRHQHVVPQAKATPAKTVRQSSLVWHHK